MESGFTLTLHGLTFAGIAGIFVVLLRQHKVWIRIKDRMNTLWAKHCKETGDKFIPLDNGHS